MTEARNAIEIDIRCACGGALLIQYQPDNPYRDDLCKLAVGWVASHSECQKRHVVKELAK